MIYLVVLVACMKMRIIALLFIMNKKKKIFRNISGVVEEAKANMGRILNIKILIIM